MFIHFFQTSRIFSPKGAVPQILCDPLPKKNLTRSEFVIHGTVLGTHLKKTYSSYTFTRYTQSFCWAKVRTSIFRLFFLTNTILIDLIWFTQWKNLKWSVVVIIVRRRSGHHCRQRQPSSACSLATCRFILHFSAPKQNKPKKKKSPETHLITERNKC